MHTEVDTSRFASHKETLNKLESIMKNELEDLRVKLIRLDWDDNFYERVRVALNGHIDEMNKLFAKLSGCVVAMENMQRDLEAYLNYGL